MPGRPHHDYWHHANFVTVKKGARNSALCLICNKELKNTAKVRLMAHRNICNGLPSDTVVKDEVTIIETNEDSESEEEGVEVTEVESNQQKDPFKSIEIYVEKSTNEVFITPKNTSATQNKLNESGTSQAEKINFVNKIKSERQSSSTPIPEKRLKLENATTTTRTSNEDINLAFAEFFFSCNIPFTVIDSLYFKQFVEKLNKSYKLPNLKELSTVCLDKVYEKCTSEVPSDEQSAVLILSGWKNFTDTSKYAVACLHLKNDSREFLNTWDFGIFSHPSDGLAKILDESEILAKRLYNAKIYAVISDNVDFAADSSDEDVVPQLWHTVCHSHLAGLLVEEIIDKEITKNVSQVLKEFQNAELEELILHEEGTRIVLPWGNRWCTYRDAFQCYLRNYDIMRELAAQGKCDFRSNIRHILYDDDLSDKLQEYLEMLEPLCKLIYLSQRKKSTLAEITEEWLTLEFTDGYQKLLERRRNMALSNYALAANFLHPKYRGKNLSDEQMEIVEYFFLETLDSTTLDDLFVFKANDGIFKTLTAKGITTHTTFWSLAERKHPQLATAALNLLRIPASTSYIDKLFSSWSVTHLSTRNMLGMDVYKKLMKTYFTLRLSSNKNNYVS